MPIEFEDKTPYLAATAVVGGHRYQFLRFIGEEPTRHDYQYLTNEVYTKFPQLKETKDAN